MVFPPFSNRTPVSEPLGMFGFVEPIGSRKENLQNERYIQEGPLETESCIL